MRRALFLHTGFHAVWLKTSGVEISIGCLFQVAQHMIRMLKKNSGIRLLVLITVSILDSYVLYITPLLGTLKAGIINTNLQIKNLSRLLRKSLGSFMQTFTVIHVLLLKIIHELSFKNILWISSIVKYATLIAFSLRVSTKSQLKMWYNYCRKVLNNLTTYFKLEFPIKIQCFRQTSLRW